MLLKNSILTVIYFAALIQLSYQQTVRLTGSASNSGLPIQVQERRKFRIGWALYTGWIPLDYAYQFGILKKHADLENIEIELIEELNSMNLITKFVSGEMDGYVAPINELTMLPMVEDVLEQARQSNNPDAAPLPPLSPVIIFSGSSSEGADGIISKEVSSIKDLKGKDVYLEVGTISQYFLYRALQLNNLTLDDVNMLNSPLDEWIDSYARGGVDNLVGFNPFLLFAQDEAGGELLFSSKEISREIVDVMLVHSQVLKEHPGLARAITGAYFEVMDLMYNQSGSSEIMKWMGARQNTTGEEFMMDLEFIRLFYNPQECADYLQGELLKKALANSLNYVFDVGVLDDIYSSPLEFGIDINGNIYGDRSNIKLYVDDIFCENEVRKRIFKK